MYDLCQARTLCFNFLGIVRGNSEVEIKVSFAPMDFSTAHMKLQVRLLNGKSLHSLLIAIVCKMELRT